jgi:hypothetical protein
MGSEAETDSLEQKIRSYVDFALEGQMHEMCTELHGQPWKIFIDTPTSARRPRSVGSDSQRWVMRSGISAAI